LTLQHTQPSKSICPCRGIPCDQNAEMQLRQSSGADREFTLQFAYVGGDDNAGVE
jgi:hypothetical protein